MQNHNVTANARPELAPFEAKQVIDFWVDAGHTLWFAKNAEFDRRFRARFLSRHEAAARCELGDWTRTASGSLALVLLLDQFPRNAFRGTPRMYETDAIARAIAHQAIAAGHDHAVAEDLRVFFYLPFGHSEQLADQERAVFFTARLGAPHSAHAQRHRDIVRRFGRFPHRNPILGRRMTPSEQEYLDAGGYAG
jgi:uncharacterized protein (DUF924 family)